MSHTQEWALARFREGAERNDPALYSLAYRHGLPHIWMKICGNVGWYWAEIKGGTMVDLHGEASGGCDSQIKHMNPKRLRKLHGILHNELTG
jgi:hypothetical protein